MISGRTSKIIIATFGIGANSWLLGFGPVNGDPYLGNPYSGTVSVISGRTYRVIDTIRIDVNQRVNGMAVSPVTGDVYVSDGELQDIGVQVISGQANKVIATILTGNRQNGPNRTEGIAVSPLNGDAYVVNSAGYGLWVIAD